MVTKYFRKVREELTMLGEATSRTRVFEIN